MNSISIQNFFNVSFTVFDNQILKSLTAQQKKVAMLALAVFAVLASVVVISCCCFQAKKEEHDDEMEDVDLRDAKKVKKSPRVQSENTIEIQKSLPQSEIAQSDSNVRGLIFDWIRMLDMVLATKNPSIDM